MYNIRTDHGSESLNVVPRARDVGEGLTAGTGIKFSCYGIVRDNGSLDGDLILCPEFLPFYGEIQVLCVSLVK